jgi:superoxide dismutase, Fe-Mn family
MIAHDTAFTMSRRQALARTGAVVTGLAARWLGVPARLSAAPAFALPPLPYAEHALAPVLSPQTLRAHYRQCHQGHVQQLKTLVQGTHLVDMPLEDVIRTTAGDPTRVDIFNHAAQVWNHTFYWHSMRPGGGGMPHGILAQQLETAFGGFAAFRQAMMTAAATLCGSGWVWLMVGHGTLQVHATRNADTPLVHGHVPLLTLDVWEHAYDLDYQGSRSDYITAVLAHLVNWDFVTTNLARA